MLRREDERSVARHGAGHALSWAAIAALLEYGLHEDLWDAFLVALWGPFGVIWTLLNW